MKKTLAKMVGDEQALAGLGLRERKKAKRRAKIVAAAKSGFARHGYAAFAMEDVAAAADVSVGTVYNYFPTKSELLFEMLKADMHDVIREGDRSILSNDIEGKDAILALLSSYFDWFSSYRRDLLQTFTAEAILNPKPDDPSFNYFDDVLANQVQRQLEKLKSIGVLPAAFDAALGAKLIFNIANSEFYAFLVDEDRTSADVGNRLEAQITLLWRAFLALSDAD